MFFGRSYELDILSKLRQKNTASLVCVYGRRRVGKSSLIEHFGIQFHRFVSIQGLGPDRNPTNQDQLDHFASRLKVFFPTMNKIFQNWTDAFYELAQLSKSEEILILLDEISWMGRKDPLFAARLKDAWDQVIKKNDHLILVLCGSVSTWIDENILTNINFEGRVSLAIQLQELSLPEVNEFWKNANPYMGMLEKMLLLSVTGGIPKYLEEILPTETAAQNISRLCFVKNGMLFTEYEKIFSNIFDRQKTVLEKIVRICLTKKISPTQLASRLGKIQGGDLTKLIHTLELSGFVSRDYYYKVDGNSSKLSQLRVKDNYLRFYLKYIEPFKDKINSGQMELHFDQLPQFESMMGLQFENLVLANRLLVHKKLDIKNEELISSSPYLQKKNSVNKLGCQVDLLIHTKSDLFYLCELKCKKLIDRQIMDEVKKKLAAIRLPKRSSIRPVLVYVGEIYPPHFDEIKRFFYRMVNLDDLLG